MTQPFNWKKAKKYLPYIFLIGLGVGTANYIINGDLNYVQWIILSLSTNLLIGYSLVLIASNRSWFRSRIAPFWKLVLVLFIVYFSVGAFATEVEQIIRMSIFSIEVYQPFSAGKMYFFNGIISLVLGFSFFLNEHFFPSETGILEEEATPLIKETSQNVTPPTLLTKLPLKQGKTVHLIPIQNVAYLEAFDNYSFAYDVNGEKRLCDYSLLFLQERLGENFMRVHRKSIVNTDHIKQIKLQANARYMILFDNEKLPPVMSSKGYAAIVKTLIKLD